MNDGGDPWVRRLILTRWFQLVSCWFLLISHRFQSGLIGSPSIDFWFSSVKKFNETESLMKPNLLIRCSPKGTSVSGVRRKLLGFGRSGPIATSQTQSRRAYRSAEIERTSTHRRIGPQQFETIMKTIVRAVSKTKSRAQSRRRSRRRYRNDPKNSAETCPTISRTPWANPPDLVTQSNWDTN